MFELAPEERAVVDVVAAFVDAEVEPRVRDREHAGDYPADWIERMRALGMFGLLVPEEFGGTPVSARCFALVTEELSRGWMTLAGALGGHSVVCRMIDRFGTPEQRRRYLPRLATGEMRAAMALTEPGGGSDLQGLRTIARPAGDAGGEPGGYVVDGTKMWITNARRAGLLAVLCKTDQAADPPHRGISVLLLEPAHGYQVSRDLGKLGYKGIETCEVVFDGVRAEPGTLLGGVEGRGFAHFMAGLEVGRIQVAARAVGVARAAYERALRYAGQRESFGVPIWRHQAVGNQLADMATALRAARLLTLDAAARLDAGERADLEAGMAKLFASEAAMKICLDAMRVHGAYGYSTEFDLERYFRDAPLMIIGEGTNEIQRKVITERLIQRAEGAS